MDTEANNLTSRFYKPPKWNLWARWMNYRWHTTSGTSTPRSPYKSNIDDLDGRRDSRRVSPSTSNLSLPDAVSKQPSWWRSVFKFSTPKRGGMRKHMAENIVKDNFLTLQLSLLTIVTGILDAVTYTKYHVFATKQTGNILFLAVYVIDPGHLGYNVEINIGVSIIAFVTGAVMFGTLANLFRPRRRTWMLASLSLQIILTFIATAVQEFHPEKDTGIPAYVVIALLAVASAGQITLAIGVGEPSLNTVMITGAIIQLTADKKILKKDNTPRNSRLGFIVLYGASCFLGARCQGVNGAVPMLIAACLKFAILPSFLYNRGTEPKVKKDIEMEPRKKPRANKTKRNAKRNASDASTLEAPRPPWVL